MRLIKEKTSIDFLSPGRRKIALSISALLIIVSLVSLFTRGLEFGIDFTGGTLIEVGYQQDIDLEPVRERLEQGGYGDATIQRFGTPRDILIRIAPHEDVTNEKISNDVFALLEADETNKPELRRVEFVGPQVGDELTERGGLAMLYTLIAILIYVAVRFEWRFAVGSIIALVHDVVFTVGLFAILWASFDLPVLAAILAVIGYSLNDTIVVYDRIRENFRKIRKGDKAEDEFAIGAGRGVILRHPEQFPGLHARFLAQLAQRIG